jgi:hypothetical protein
MAPQLPQDEKWYSLAEQVSREMDSAKLAKLVVQLCAALDERAKPPPSPTPSSEGPTKPPSESNRDEQNNLCSISYIWR